MIVLAWENTKAVHHFFSKNLKKIEDEDNSFEKSNY